MFVALTKMVGYIPPFGNVWLNLLLWVAIVAVLILSALGKLPH
jgi:hypothetical protein